MARRSRIKAIDFMWQDAQYVCGVGFQEDRTEAQEALAISISEIANNPLTPYSVVEALGDIVRKAHQIGYDHGWKSGLTARLTTHALLPSEPGA
jgi:hypothetical protein